MTAYSHVPFTKVFKRVERKIELDDQIEYSCVGLQLYGLGAFVRERKLGVEIKRKAQWLVKQGDFVYNKLFAWKGTFAVIGPACSDCIVSDKYPTYQFDRTILDERYLKYFIQSESVWRQAELMSKGAAALSKFTLNPPDFWRLKIPLPSLEEQGKIVSMLDDILCRYKALQEIRRPLDAVVQGRRAGIGSECRFILTGVLNLMDEKFEGSIGKLEEVLTLRPRSGPSFPCSDSGGGIRIVMPSALGGYRFDENKCMFGFGGEAISELDILEEGDLLISRGNKRDQVGLCIVYHPKDNRTTTYANLLMRMKVNGKKVTPQFVKYWLMSPLAVNYIQRNTKGTSPAIQKINQAALLRLPFPLDIPIPCQEAWVSYLDQIFEMVELGEKEVREEYEKLQELRRTLLLDIFHQGEL